MSSAERSRLNAFADTPLDRCGERRADTAWLLAQQAAPAARTLAFDADGCVPMLASRLQWLLPEQIAADAPVNFLGVLAGAPLFALRTPVARATFTHADWMDLRSAALGLDHAEAALVAFARALAHWQSANRYCSACGGALVLLEGGHRGYCEACKRLHFPRTDPAIIVIVEQGDACLLGRQANWRAGQYSALAGFVEPGESLAGAVRREVREETGVEVLDCDFHSSQPWPFPASLMLGFTATAAGRDIRLVDGELEDARWFTARDIAAGLRDGSLRVSTPLSISFRLLEHWLRTRAGVELAALPRAGWV